MPTSRILTNHDAGHLKAVRTALHGASEILIISGYATLPGFQFIDSEVKNCLATGGKVKLVLGLDRTGVTSADLVNALGQLLHSYPENPHSCTKSATNCHTFGEVSATQPAAPTPLKGARRHTGPHSRLPGTEGRSRLRVPGRGGRNPQMMAALRQRGVFDVVRPHACAVAQADRCGAGWRPVSTMQRCAQTHRRRGSEPDRDRDAQGC